MLGTEPRRLERDAHNLQRAIRAPAHGPPHRRWVANRTADATSIRPEILRSVRQIDSLALENPSISVPIGHSISRAELPSTTQNWQHCTDVYSRLAVRRLEGWPLARSLVAVLRDARNPSRRAPQVGHARLRMTCALLRTRIPTSETQYWRELALCGARRVYNEDAF